MDHLINGYPMNLTPLTQSINLLARGGANLNRLTLRDWLGGISLSRIIAGFGTFP